MYEWCSYKINFLCVTLQVEVVLQKVMRYMFPVFSLIVFTSTLCITTSTYTVLCGTLHGGSSVNLMVICFLTLAFLCHLGHKFISQVVYGDHLGIYYYSLIF